MRQSDDPTGFLRPRYLVGLDIPVPVTHLSDALRTLETLLAGAQRLFSFLTLGDIPTYAQGASRLAGVIQEHSASNQEPMRGPVWPSDAKFSLQSLRPFESLANEGL